VKYRSEFTMEILPVDTHRRSMAVSRITGTAFFNREYSAKESDTESKNVQTSVRRTKVLDRWYNKVLRIIGRIRNSNLFLYPVLIGSSNFETTYSDQSLARDDYNHLLSTLQTPTAITDLTTLLTCLSAPLDALGLLPPRYRHLLSGNNTDLNINLRKYVPQIQQALLTNRKHRDVLWSKQSWGCVVHSNLECSNGDRPPHLKK